MKLTHEGVIETRAVTRAFLLAAVEQTRAALMKVEAQLSSLAQKSANRRDAELVELSQKYGTMSDDAPVLIEQTRLAKLVLSVLSHTDSPIAALVIKRDALQTGLRALTAQLDSYPDPNPPLSLSTRLFQVFTPLVRTFEDFCRACPTSLVREMASSGEILRLNSSEVKEYGSKLTQWGGYGAELPFAKIGDDVGRMQAQLSRAAEPKSEEERAHEAELTKSMTPGYQQAVRRIELHDEINKLESQINNWPALVANGEWSAVGETRQNSLQVLLTSAKTELAGLGSAQ